MASGYKIYEPSGKPTVIVADDRDEAKARMLAIQERWEDYCDRNWLNDSGNLFSPESKVKLFLDSLAYYYLLGNTQGIVTDYKKVMHAKREIPVSNCPAYVENLLYSTVGTTSQADREEAASFKTMLEKLDATAEKYETQKTTRKKSESLFHKKNRLGIHGGEWCRVDTENKFWHNNSHYQIDEKETQYQPVDTEYGEYYAMDRILVTDNGCYDMNYDQVNVYWIGGICDDVEFHFVN